jgi:hypothetical protein
VSLKRPKGDGWRVVPTPPAAASIALECAAYEHALGIRVITAIEELGEGPEFHVSVSYRGGRAPRSIMQIVRHAFDMKRAEEDNHASSNGVVRNLWARCDRVEVACACADEPTIVTPFGGADESGDEFVFREEPKA